MNPYVECPTITTKSFTIRLIRESDSKSLFRCYNDKKVFMVEPIGVCAVQGAALQIVIAVVKKTHYAIHYSVCNQEGQFPVSNANNIPAKNLLLVTTGWSIKI